MGRIKKGRMEERERIKEKRKDSGKGEEKER